MKKKVCTNVKHISIEMSNVSKNILFIQKIKCHSIHTYFKQNIIHSGGKSTHIRFIHLSFFLTQNTKLSGTLFWKIKYREITEAQ